MEVTSSSDTEFMPDRGDSDLNEYLILKTTITNISTTITKTDKTEDWKQ